MAVPIFKDFLLLLLAFKARQTEEMEEWNDLVKLNEEIDGLIGSAVLKIPVEYSLQTANVYQDTVERILVTTLSRIKMMRVPRLDDIIQQNAALLEFLRRLTELLNETTASLTRQLLDAV